jgi:hypothetical protein
MRDEEVQVLSHNDHHLHVHVENTEVAGVHHLGVYVEGTYCAEHSILHGDNHDHHHEMHSADASACGPECHYEGFTRLLNIALAVVKRNERAATKKKKKLMKKRR